MANKLLKASDVIDGLPENADSGLTPNQANYLNAVLESGGQATQKQLLSSISINNITLCRWRKSADFRKAERYAYRNAISESLPSAVAALKRLLRADLDYGAKGVATTERATFRLLEVAGIFNSPQAAPAVQLATVLKIDSDNSSKPMDISVQTTLPEAMDAEWE